MTMTKRAEFITGFADDTISWYKTPFMLAIKVEGEEPMHMNFNGFEPDFGLERKHKSVDELAGPLKLILDKHLAKFGKTAYQGGIAIFKGCSYDVYQFEDKPRKHNIRTALIQIGQKIGELFE